MKNFPSRQRGISLVWVAVGMATLTAISMATLFSMRHERNYFAEGWTRVTGSATGASVARESDAAMQAARRTLGQAGLVANDGVLRKCVINGKSVVSNIDCKSENHSSRTIEIHHDSQFVVPKAVAPEAPAPALPDLHQRAIEQATR